MARSSPVSPSSAAKQSPIFASKGQAHLFTFKEMPARTPVGIALISLSAFVIQVDWDSARPAHGEAQVLFPEMLLHFRMQERCFVHLLAHNIKMAVLQGREISKSLSVSASRTVFSETFSLGCVSLRLHPSLTRTPAPARVPWVLLHHQCNVPTGRRPGSISVVLGN